MGASLTILRVRGIDVRVHWSFLLILVYGAFAYSQSASSLLVGALYGVLTIILLFVCVTLHEFGHAFVAQHYNVQVSSIMLLPIGGVANLEKVPEKPSQEFIIAIVGPLVNFALALLLAPVVFVAVRYQAQSQGASSNLLTYLADLQSPGVVNMLVYLLSVNLLLGLFNLLPAFPMDGGRILRSLLAMGMDYVKATRISVAVGRMMAILLAVWGIFLWASGGSGLFMLLIAFFVYVGGGAEREAVESRAVLRGYTASEAITPDAENFFVTDTIGKAADRLLVSYQTDFPIIDLGGDFAGVLTRNNLIRALRESGADMRIVDAMIPADQVPTCEPETDLSQVMETMSRSGLPVMAVKRASAFLGIITLEDINEVFNVMSAARGVSSQLHAQAAGTQHLRVQSEPVIAVTQHTTDADSTMAEDDIADGSEKSSDG